MEEASEKASIELLLQPGGLRVGKRTLEIESDRMRTRSGGEMQLTLQEAGVERQLLKMDYKK
jgi:hypothetical protein